MCIHEANIHCIFQFKHKCMVIFFYNINVHKETKKVEELQNLKLKQVLPISFKMGILTDKFLLDV